MCDSTDKSFSRWQKKQGDTMFLSRNIGREKNTLSPRHPKLHCDNVHSNIIDHHIIVTWGHASQCLNWKEVTVLFHTTHSIHSSSSLCNSSGEALCAIKRKTKQVELWTSEQLSYLAIDKKGLVLKKVHWPKVNKWLFDANTSLRRAVSITLWELQVLPGVI